MTELAPQSKDGSYVRPTYSFTGQLGSSSFPLEEGRYHLYVGNACPWCHRLTLAHTLRGLLQKQISYSYAIDDPEKASRGGWAFEPEGRGGGREGGKEHVDRVFGCRDLREVYDLCAPGYTGRCTAPVLIDKKTKRIVNNESSDLLRSLNLFSPPSLPQNNIDLYPPPLRPKINEINAWIYPKINNGVYRCGFATTQKGYEEGVEDVFEGLARVEQILEKQRFLAGSVLTEADVSEGGREGGREGGEGCAYGTLIFSLSPHFSFPNSLPRQLTPSSIPPFLPPSHTRFLGAPLSYYRSF